MLYYVTILIIVGFLVYGIKEYIQWGDFSDVIASILWGVLTSFVYCGFVLIASLFFPITHIHDASFKIYALQDNSTMNGNFFLGTGNMEGSQVYTFVKPEEGGKKISTINVDDAILYEGEVKPRIDVYKPILKSKIVRKLFFGSIFGSDQYKIYIPKGTIIKDYYNVNLK